MGRYLVDSFTSASVAGSGGVLDFARTLTNNFIDIFKIKITPSGGGTTSKLQIFSNSTRLPAEILYDSGAFAGAVFYDPVEDNAGSYAERNEGFVARYYDTTSALSLFCRLTNNDVAAQTYAIEITYAVSAFSANVQSSPDMLVAQSIARGLDITATVLAGKNSVGIDEAEFRAMLVAPGDALPEFEDLRTAAEGGTFAHDGTTKLIVTGIVANQEGALYQWTSSAQGTWYFVWKLHNVSGWSRWTDGNLTPQTVSQTCVTNTTYDTGAPSGWAVTLEKGPISGTYIAHVTRPATNGNVIQYWCVQVKDASTGSWRELDANAGAAETHYDGSGANHQYDPATLQFVTPAAWGTAAIGDLVLVDVLGNGTWTLSKCQWLVVKSISGVNMTVVGKWRPLLNAHTGGGVYDQVRLKIVKAPWAWITEGFLGAQPNGGFWAPTFFDFSPEGFLNDVSSREFVSAPISVPAAVTQVEARVWFENAYSRNDNSNAHSTGYIGGDGLLGPTDYTSFTDPKWWVRLIGGTQGTLTLNANGTLTFTTPLATGTNKYGFWGVAHRSRIVPDEAGLIQVTAGFTALTLDDDGTHENTTTSLCLFMETISSINGASGSQHTMRGIAARATYDSGMKLEIGEVEIQNGGAIMFEPNILTTIAMPASPFTLDLRLTIQESPTEKVFGFYTFEYSVDSGASWTPIAYTTMNTYVPGGIVSGLKPVIVFCQNNRMTGHTGTLSTFSVNKGLIIGDAI
jgi:hypothetical protein